jgi:cytochrome c-type biogenesis protein CcmH/NrfG
LSQAEADVANGDVVAALSAYAQVLAVEPRNVVALTQTGWLDFSAGSADHRASLVSLGVSDLARALALAPNDPAPRLYYAIVAASTPGERSLAVKEFRIFLSLRPSNGQLAVAAPFLRQLGLAPR